MSSHINYKSGISAEQKAPTRLLRWTENCVRVH